MMRTTDPSVQEITMSSEIPSHSSTPNNEITSNNKDFTETKKSTMYVSITNTHLNYENITLPISKEVITDKFLSTTEKKQIYQTSTVIIIITVIGSIIILIILIAVLGVKCKKYMRNQIIQRRRNRIFREVGMIPMRSVINERCMRSEER